MHQAVTPGYLLSKRRWNWCVGASVHPDVLVFNSCKNAAHYAAMRAERDGGEVVVVIPGGEVRMKTFDTTGRDNGLRVVGADLLWPDPHGGWGRRFWGAC